MNRNSTLQENGFIACPGSTMPRVALLSLAISCLLFSAVFAQNNSGPCVASGSFKSIAAGNDIPVSQITTYNPESK
jgi:hypothetical protein